MFSRAYDIAFNYTPPVIISSKNVNNIVQCGGGAFVIINNEGWIITVAHLFETAVKFNQDRQLIENYDQEVQMITNNPTISPHNKNKKIAKLKKNPEWLTKYSMWWGKDGRELKDLKVYPEIDLAVGRIQPFDPNEVKIYPKFKNPNHLKPGTSLCKLGYPFHQATATYNDSTNTFEFAPGSIPVPIFPIEGILTRFKLEGKTTDGKFEKKFIETSSPGLRGQSGGPIFDINATIWGIQSKTDHLPLGFSPKIKKGGKEVEENQFINVGLGVHPDNIIKVLTECGIKFEMVD